MGEYANPDSLVAPARGPDNLGGGGFKLVAVDEEADRHDRGHIPGAVSLHWRNELQDEVIRDFVSKEKFEKLLSQKGIGNDDLVVLYGGNNNWFAAYAFWYFQVYRHQHANLMNYAPKKRI